MTIDDATKELMRLSAEAMIRNGEAILAIVDAAGGVTEYVSVDQYAERTGVSRSTVQRQLLAGQIPGARKVGKQWAIRWEVAS